MWPFDRYMSTKRGARRWIVHGFHFDSICSCVPDAFNLNRFPGLTCCCASSSACSQPFSLFHLGSGKFETKARCAPEEKRRRRKEKEKAATAFVVGPFDPKLLRTSLKSVYTVSHLVVLDMALRVLATRPAFRTVMTVAVGGSGGLKR